MSKIKVFGLGGLNENGKNMYVIEIDNNIFIFEAGLKYTKEGSLGIDYVIPNYDYLKDNKEKIKGIFLTHGHDENIGALGDILPSLGNVKVYGAKFTIDLVKKELEAAKINYDNLIEIKAHSTISIDGINIFPVSMSHSIPDNLGYAVYTPDGIIFIATDFVFDSSMRGSYQMDVGKLAYIGKQGVLCLLVESMYASRVGYTSPNHRISSLIRQTLNKENGRIIFNILSSHIYRIQELFNEVSKTNRKIVIMSKKLQNMINYAIDNNYVNIDRSIIGDLSNLNDENVVIIVSNEREKPYSSIVRIIDGYDKYVKLNDTDTVFIAIPIYEGSEKNYYDIADKIAKIGANLVSLSPKTNLALHASSEDIMLLIDLMKPKYYFPIKGEYRYMVSNGDIASKLGIPNENIILKQNGDVALFENGALTVAYEKVPSGEILIDGEFSDNVGEVVLKDREMLKENGIVIITSTLSKTTKEIISGPEVISKGFVYMKDSSLLIEKIKEIVTNIIKNNVSKNYIDYNKIKTMIRDELGKYLYKETECNPIVINNIQEI